MKRTILLIAFILSLTTLATAHVGEDELNHTKEIIASDTPCSELTEDEIANIGDYYMEQMHPGEMHDVMDEHMGGEGSEILRQAHIDMGQEFYCDRFTSDSSSQRGWMPMMGGTWRVGSMAWFGILLWIGVLLLVLLGIIYLLKQLLENRKTPESPDDGENND